jgi:hypothetical protein
MFFREILPPAQKVIWPLLTQIPSQFVLYGGTAIALRFRHRTSVDFDFFTNTLSPDELRNLVRKLPILDNFQSNTNYRSDSNQYDIEIFVNELNLSRNEQLVKITLLSNKAFISGCLAEPDVMPDNNIKIASPKDLFSHKVLAVSSRSVTRDFLDIAEFIRQGFSLQDAFIGCWAIARIEKDARKINLPYLKNDLQSKTLCEFIPYNDYLTIKEAAAQVDLDKVFNSKVIVYDNLYDISQNSLTNYVKVKKKDRNLSDFIKSHIWNGDPVLLNDLDQFLVFIMALRPILYYELTEDFGLTDQDFVRAIKKTQPGFFHENEWIAWHQRLNIDNVPPLPRKY